MELPIPGRLDCRGHCIRSRNNDNLNGDFGEKNMPTVTWDHVHLRSPDPEATAAWLHDILGGEIIRGPGRIDVKLGGANVFIAPVTAGDGVNTSPVTPYQGLDHFGLSREGHRRGRRRDQGQGRRVHA